MTLSILMPVYKDFEIINKCIESVIAQNYTDFELLIGDDSLSEDVQKMIEVFNDNRIIFFKNTKGLGSIKNTNHLLEHASGKYIKIQHQDDIMFSEDSLGDAMNDITKNNYDCYFGKVVVYHEKLKRVSFRKYCDNLNAIVKKNPQVLYGNNYIGSPSNFIFKTNLKEYFNENFKYFVDVDFYIKVISKSKKLGNSIGFLTLSIHARKYQISKDVESSYKYEALEFLDGVRKYSEDYPSEIKTYWSVMLSKYGYTFYKDSVDRNINMKRAINVTTFIKAFIGRKVLSRC